MGGTYCKLLYHIVFSTKDRRPFIDALHEEELYRYIGGICRAQGAVLLEAGGMPDHVHLLLKLNPIHRLSDLMRDIKANSSGWLRGRVSDFAWQDGYAAFTVSESQFQAVVGYIQSQKDHHLHRDFKSELEAIFSRHGMEVDRQLLWN